MPSAVPGSCRRFRSRVFHREIPPEKRLSREECRFFFLLGAEGEADRPSNGSKGPF